MALLPKKRQWHLAHAGQTATAQCHWLEMLKIGVGFESMIDIWRSLCLLVLGFQNIHSSLCKCNFYSSWSHMGNSPLLSPPQSLRQPKTNSLVSCLKHFARGFLQSTCKKNLFQTRDSSFHVPQQRTIIHSRLTINLAELKFYTWNSLPRYPTQAKINGRSKKGLSVWITRLSKNYRFVESKTNALTSWR